jgi:hypothetical protein
MSSVVALFALTNQASAGNPRDVFTGPSALSWGNHVVDMPTSTSVTILTNGQQTTAGLAGLIVDVLPTGKVTDGAALWYPPGSSSSVSATFTSGSIGNGKATMDGTIPDGSKLKVVVFASGLNSASVNSLSTTSGTGVISATIW